MGTLKVYTGASFEDVTHDAVTLDANAATFLTLTVQEMGLQAQAANTFFAGPATGSPAVPTMRAMTTADLPNHATLHEVGGADQVLHNSLLGYVGNEHINHSMIILTAGDGMTGGGDITMSRVFDVGAGDGIDVAADSIAVDLASPWSGLGFSSGKLWVDRGAAFVWTAAHEFQVGATITAGQSLYFGADVELTRGGADVLNLASGDAFRSSNFSSGVSGWAIDADGSAEFLNCFVRGELHAAVFVKDLIDARAGSMVIVKSAGVLSGDVAVPGSGTWTIDVNDPPGGGFLFENSDICTIKVEYTGGVAQIWFTVSGRVDNGDGTQRYTCTWQNGTRSITYPAGAPVLDYGVSGDGGILMTADLNYAPWISVFTHAGSPWTTTSSHLKIGNLNGEADYSTDEYGIFIGNYAADSWMAYDPTNGLRIRGDALIDGTVSATTFTNDVGAMFFTLADGLALWGPGCEIGPTSWVSTRGQAATISGAFHQEWGRWVGTRGLVIEEGTTNLVTNPSFETGTTGWASSWGDTLAQSTTYARYGDNSLQVTPAGGAGIGVKNDVTVTASQEYTFSAWVYVPDTWDGGNLTLRIYDGASYGTLIAFSSTISERNRWVRYQVSGTPSTTTLRCVAFANPTSTVPFYVDGAQVEQKGYETTYCDGSLGTGYAWSGTAHASTSTRTATQVNLDDQAVILDGNDEFAVSLWWQPQYDYDGTWPQTIHNYLFQVYEDSSNYFRVSFSNSVNSLATYFTGVGGSQSASYQLEFSAGDWVHIVVNVDVAGDIALAINGVIEDSGDLSSSSAISPDQMNLGSDYAGANQAGGVYSELAIFDRVLTADEIAALFHRGTPLVDAGSLETPGVYIYDGKVRIMSSTTGKHTEIVAAGIGIYEDTGPTGVGRLLGGFVDLTAKELDITSDDLGWFGYDGSDVLQVAWYASGSDAGKITAGGGVLVIDEDGIVITATSSYTDPRSYKFTDGTNIFARVGAYYDTNATSLELRTIEVSGLSSFTSVTARSPTGETSEVNLNAYVNGGAGGLTRIQIRANYPLGDYVELTGYLAVTDGLVVGNGAVSAMSDGAILFQERSSDPSEPPEGYAVIWMSDGTGKGADGDVMIASKAGGTTRYTTLFDHSAGSAW